MAHSRTRIGARALIAAVTTALTLTIAACGSSSDTQSGAGDKVSVNHRRGTTEITGVPTRIVALGNQWLDALEILGATPIGYLDNVSIVSGGDVPWEPASLPKDRAIQPGGDLVEKVAAMNPDLILAPSFLVDQTKFDKLSRLAPTITDLTAAQVDPWSEQVKTLGRVLHKEADADKAIADIYGNIDAVGRKYPGLKGKTFLTSFLAGPQQLMVLADAKDGSSELFVRLGMTVPEKLAAQTGAGGRLSLSPERVGDLTSDLLVASGNEANYKALPGYADLPSVRKNSVTFLSMGDVTGLNQPTPLALPYLLKKLEPALANAAG
ncbi:ABC transporter substrate-binding protein [Nocardia stercoris]|uniref:ABC transporter substrate-binding protein n=1 Tax=Nocardia stercoris TaxID=2483361 RepID=A0A3M2KRT9_9NOCA|nr:ABC transporter substrate-binding protein [Nocardia stercoris]RMI28367.1 ABC transporter substrate-binding protein [Nocardia stercoris]